MHSLTPEYLDPLRSDATQVAMLRLLGGYQGNHSIRSSNGPAVAISKGNRVRLVLRAMNSEEQIASTGSVRTLHG